MLLFLTPHAQWGVYSYLVVNIVFGIPLIRRLISSFDLIAILPTIYANDNVLKTPQEKDKFFKNEIKFHLDNSVANKIESLMSFVIVIIAFRIFIDQSMFIGITLESIFLAVQITGMLVFSTFSHRIRKQLILTKAEHETNLEFFKNENKDYFE